MNLYWTRHVIILFSYIIIIINRYIAKFNFAVLRYKWIVDAYVCNCV
uniref:Uncharacterized protein n=1 Tax=Podoviridae sp. ctZkC8 TaxID=2825259 RepID=A0A8S5UC72_9CAUD|nr:MAG TPA: hypothetical protein [Podoviridae sp. ctZkC8]